MLKQVDTVPVKDVEEYMISAGLLALLAVIDYMKKEIHILVLLPVTIIWLIMPIWNDSISISSIVAAVSVTLAACVKACCLTPSILALI